MDDHSKERWAAQTGLREHWRAWGDEIVVFNGLSGKTHCLNGRAAQMLQLLAETAMTASELTARLNRDVGMPQISFDEVQALLLKFDDVGLVSPVVP
jgi:PqqD family protein of HPr-rel-A system